MNLDVMKFDTTPLIRPAKITKFSCPVGDRINAKINQQLVLYRLSSAAPLHREMVDRAEKKI